MKSGVISTRKEIRPRSEGCLITSELDTVIGNDVKTGTIYFVTLEKLTKLVNEIY